MPLLTGTIKGAVFLLILAVAQAWTTPESVNQNFQPQNIFQLNDNLARYQFRPSVHNPSYHLREIKRQAAPPSLGRRVSVHMHGVDDWGNLQGHNVYPPTGGSCNDDHMEVIGFFFQSAIKRKMWTPKDGFDQEKTGWEDFGGLTYVQATMATHPGIPALVDIVYTDENHELKLRSISEHLYANYSMSLGIRTVDAPLALGLPGDSLAVFARSAHDGKLRSRFMQNKANGPVWDKKWTVIDGRHRTVSTPSGGVLPDGTVYLFAKSGRRNLKFTFKKPGGKWSRWQPLQNGGDAIPAVALTPVGGIVIALRNRKGHIFVGMLKYQHKFVWKHLGGPFSTDPGITVTSSDRILVFAADKENDLMKVTWEPKTKWGEWSSLNFENRVIFRPTVFSRGENAEVFVVQAQSEIRHKTIT